MNGWLIYSRAGAKRNEWFIARLQQEFAKYSVELSLIIADCADDLPLENLPNFAICRAMNADFNAVLESKGVRTFNNAKTAKIAGDKWETYLLCERLNIPFLPAVLAENNIQNATYPKVVKSRFGHGGNEVFWAENSAQAQKIVDKKDKYLLQKPSYILGKDTRVYAIGETIVAAIERTAKSGFKSNFSLGGNVQKVQPTDEQIKIVKKLQNELKFDFIGIDFLPDEKGMVLNEMEDAAGTRMLYACTDIDIVEIFTKHVLQTLKN